MSYETILVDKENFVTTVTFNRPEKRNAMSPQMHLEMCEVLRELAVDNETRVLILTGAGNSFCAGQDLNKYFYELDDKPQEQAKARRAATEWRANLLRLFPKPTIAAVNGWCFGGAFTVVANCDIAIAAEEAKFGLSEVNFGKMPGGHVTKAVTELFHPRDALFYILTGKAFSGVEAAQIKFVNFAVPLNDLKTTVKELAEDLAQKNPLVLSAAKEAYRYGKDMNWEQAGAWLNARSRQMDLASGKTWKTGVEQFKQGSYRPGLGNYEWSK